MDFKWTLSRPGIALEFETGSIKEAIGLLEAEGTQISEVFGFAFGGTESAIAAPAAGAEGSGTEPARRTRGPNKTKPPVEAVAPEPLPVPAAPVAPAAPPPAPIAPAVASAPVLPSPPTAPVAPPPGFEIPADGGLPPALVRAPPPVGVLGPKVVNALNVLREGKPDGGQALADWLAAAGLTIKGKTYDEATRAVLMISDEKITAAGVLEPLGIS